MHFTALRKVMPAYLDSGVSLELRSAPGRGKSEFTADMVTLMGKRDGRPWGFATAFLATYTPVDLLGYMVPGVDAKGRRVSEFTMPPWMRCVDGSTVFEHERGILFLDEFGQAEADVKRAAAELLLNKQIGPWRLPPGWSVVAATNRAQDRSGVTKSFDFVINRRLEIDITDDLQSWEDWAFEHGVNPVFITFANQNPQIVFSDGVPEKQGPWCTPRSLVLLARIFEQMGGVGIGDKDGIVPTDPVAMETAAGIIGAGAAAQLMAFVKLGQEMPSFDEIVSKPDKAKLPTKPDAQMLVCYSLAARVTEAEVGNVITYVERMPKEFTVTFAKAACRRDPDLVNTAAFGSWAVRNASLMAAIVEHR